MNLYQDLIDKSSPYTIIGADVQTRGIAIASISLESGEYISSVWIPIEKQSHEGYISSAYDIMSRVTSEIQPEIVTIEQPTAVRSSSTPVLWGMYGAAIAGAYNNCRICESIVVPSWKKLSGLNQWSKTNKGVGNIKKENIPEAISEILSIKDKLSPNDIYDSIAISYASYKRNLGRTQ